jgi:ribosome biogenesis GTPase
MSKRHRRKAIKPKKNTPQAEPNGRVTGRLGPVFMVETESGPPLSCVARGAGKAAVVGDRVVFIPEVQTELAEGLIVEVGERSSTLVRMDALGRRAQVLAANLDRIFIVSAVEPALREGFIDRYLVAAHAQGIESHIVINKIDLLGEGALASMLERLDAYRQLGIPIHLLSAHSGQGLEAFINAFGDHSSILVGHSGVGKTSLINALCPDVEERVKVISAATGRGQHTTTTSAMYRLPNGGEVIDSPGVRGFGLWGVSANMLRDHFPELSSRADECRFADCQHVNEPRCAVRLALDEDLICKRRYNSYLSIRRSLLDETH